MTMESYPDDKSETNIELTEVDYIAAEDVARRGSGRDGIEAIVRDADRFGNVINAILIDGDTYAYASRRDDCKVKDNDGTIHLPDWHVKAAGNLTVESVPEVWDGAGDGEIIEWTMTGATDIEDIYMTDGNLVVEIYEQYEGEYGTVEFAFEN